MEQAWTVIVFRLMVAFGLSFVIGIERQLSRKPVGFGTYALVSTGSCLFVLVHIQMKFVGVDLGLAGGLAAGVGFLGSGVLMQQRGTTVQGFTTASTIWLMAGMGASVGAGMYQTAGASFAMVLVVLLIDKALESIGGGGYRKPIKMVLADREKMAGAIAALAPYKGQVTQFQWDAEHQALTLIVHVSVPPRKIGQVLDDLHALPGLVSAAFD